MGLLHYDCPGNRPRMITAGFSRLKPRTVTCEDKFGREPSPEKFSLTPSSLVPSPDMSPHMAEERGTISEDINVIFCIIISANLTMTESTPERNGKKKTPQLANIV